MAKNTSDKLSYGIILLIFGVLFLLQKIGLLAKIPYGQYVISFSSFFFIAGAVFLATQPKRALGWIFIAIGVFLNAGFFFGQISEYSYLLVPAGLIIAGAAMILSSRK